MAFSVFVSYSTRDILFATHVKQLLEAVGAHVFVAEYSLLPGTVLADEIINAIKGCDLFILLWSTHARSSDWVPQEIGIAKAVNKHIIPIMLESGLKLPGFLSDLKYLPLYNNPTKALTWLQDTVSIQTKNKYKEKEKQAQKEALIRLGVVGVVLWLLASSEK